MNYKDIPSEQLISINNLGDLKRAGYQSRSIKEELREYERQKADQS